MLKSLLPRTTNLQKTSRKEFPSFSTLLNFPLYEFYLQSLPILTYLGNFYAKMEEPKNLKQKKMRYYSILYHHGDAVNSPDPPQSTRSFVPIPN